VPELGPGEADYVAKPLRIVEVLARARALLRGRNPERREEMPCYGDLVLDEATCQARRGSRPLDLTPAEYRLLSHLLANAERVLSKEQISRHVWGEYRANPAIEKLVSRLRRKVDQETPALIHTCRGGYWLGCPVVETPGQPLPSVGKPSEGVRRTPPTRPSRSTASTRPSPRPASVTEPRSTPAPTTASPRPTPPCTTPRRRNGTGTALLDLLARTL
jgi:DNA-binding winged helix-turn-helix (wHTH) protein